jgi:hypothetical protein
MNTKTITLDGKQLFNNGDHTLQVESWGREALEKRFAGVDGVVSVDLGRRGRKLKQRGWLTAASKAALKKKCEKISAYINGQAYELVDANDTVYTKVRMDSFQLISELCAASPVRCEYEVTYTQLGE